MSAALAVGGMTAVAAPASATSAAATAFSNCMNPYLSTSNLAGSNDNLRKAILYTGYARCYYNLSQRSDATYDQQINGIANGDTYYAWASIYVIKTGVAYYHQWLNKYKLLGVGL